MLRTNTIYVVSAYARDPRVSDAVEERACAYRTPKRAMLEVQEGLAQDAAEAIEAPILVEWPQGTATRLGEGETITGRIVSGGSVPVPLVTFEIQPVALIG